MSLPGVETPSNMSLVTKQLPELLYRNDSAQLLLVLSATQAAFEAVTRHGTDELPSNVLQWMQNIREVVPARYDMKALHPVFHDFARKIPLLPGNFRIRWGQHGIIRDSVILQPVIFDRPTGGTLFDERQKAVKVIIPPRPIDPCLLADTEIPLSGDQISVAHELFVRFAKAATEGRTALDQIGQCLFSRTKSAEHALSLLERAFLHYRNIRDSVRTLVQSFDHRSPLSFSSRLILMSPWVIDAFQETWIPTISQLAEKGGIEIPTPTGSLSDDLRLLGFGERA